MIDPARAKELAKLFGARLQQEPEEVRPHGRSVEANLKELSKPNLDEKEREDLLKVLPSNLKRFEHWREKLRAFKLVNETEKQEQ